MRDGTETSREFGDYEVFEELGRGALGEAYLARPLRGEHAGRLVCLKIMSRDFQASLGSHRGDAIESFRREARIVSQLRHPNIARLLDSGAYNDVWFVAFELVQGANLGEVLALQPPGVGLAPELVRRIGFEVAAALQCAHEHDVLHRDVKPSNILIDVRGEVKLVDFGLAKANARQAEEFTAGIGTPRYFAPEQVRHEPLGPETDIYALGIVLYELLTTAHPYDEIYLGKVEKSAVRGTLKQDLQQRGVPTDLADVVERCLRADASRRFRSAEALREALHRSEPPDGLDRQLGQLANAAMTMLAEARSFVYDSNHDDLDDLDDRLQEPVTRRYEVYEEETRSRDPQWLAGAVKDAMPGAMSSHLRRELMSDLNALTGEGTEAPRLPVGAVSYAHAIAEKERGRRRPEPITARRFPRKTRLTPATPLIESPRVPPVAAVGDVPVVKKVPRATTKRVARSIAAGGALTLAVAIALAGQSLQGRHTAGPSASRTRAIGTAPRVRSDSAQQPAQKESVAPDSNELADGELACHSDVVLSSSEGAGRECKSADAASGRAASPAARSRSVRVGVVPFGSVSIDGKLMGEAPVVVELSPGAHRIVGRNRELRRAQTVIVTPDVRRVVLDLRDAEASP